MQNQIYGVVPRGALQWGLTREGEEGRWYIFLMGSLHQLQWGLTREGEEGAMTIPADASQTIGLQWGLTREGEEGAWFARQAEKLQAASMGPHP